MCGPAWVEVGQFFDGLTSHRRPAVAKGHKKSIIALAHKVVGTIYAMLVSGSHYQDRRVAYEAQSVARNAPRRIKMLRKHGFIARTATA